MPSSAIHALPIPMRWEVAEYFRNLEAIKARAEREEWEPWREVEETICRILTDNQEIRKRFEAGHKDFVYGLGAIGLQNAGLLRGSKTIVCALRDVEREGKENQPGRHREVEKVTVFATGHRYFVLPDGQEVDPLFRYYSKAGAIRLQHFGKMYTRPYPYSVARGAIAYYMGGKKQSERFIHGAKQNWFNNVIHKLSRKQRLTPDTFGVFSGLNDAMQKAAVRRRIGFEAMLRLLVPRFQKESEEQWEAMLSAAIRLQFPMAPKASVRNLLARVKSDYGAPAPKGTIWEPRRKIKLVEPSFTGDRQDT